MEPKPERRRIIIDFLVGLLCPFLVGKTLIIYFGQEYAAHPGEGFGYPLVASILFTAGTLARLVYKYRNVEDL